MFGHFDLADFDLAVAFGAAFAAAVATGAGDDFADPPLNRLTRERTPASTFLASFPSATLWAINSFLSLVAFAFRAGVSADRIASMTSLPVLTFDGVLM